MSKIRSDCEKCSNMCCNYLTPLVLKDERDKIVKHTQKEPFVKKMGYFVLEAPCYFFKDGLCSIYDIRPIDCRAFPYVVVDDLSVKKDMTLCGSNKIDGDKGAAIKLRDRINKKIISDYYQKYSYDNVTKDAEFTEKHSLAGESSLLLLCPRFVSGNSSLQQCNDVVLCGAKIESSYLGWKCNNIKFIQSETTSKSRALFWYTNNISIHNSNIKSPKAIRECKKIKVVNSEINSVESFWNCEKIEISESTLNCENYSFLKSKNITINDSKLFGEYSLEYVKNMMINDTEIVGKDALWHAENIVIKNCKIIGDYIGWYSKKVTIIDSEIIGEQPFCFSDKVKMVNCRMKNSAGAFEYASRLSIKVNGSIESVHNPKSGIITANSVGDLVFSDKNIDKTRTKIITHQ